jgi:signal peptidase I
MTQQDVATWAPPAQPRMRRAGRIVFWALIGLAIAVLVASVAIPVVTIQPYLEQSTSMQPALAPGDRLLAVRGSSGIRRGDIVVLRVPAKVSGTNDLFVKRVIGLPGEHVACCNAKGQVTVNGRALSENYLYPGNRPSRTSFSVTVRAGEIWVMGDHRNISVDSRKWGQVPLHGVVARVIVVGHGSSFATVRTPQTFVTNGLAPTDTRLNLYVRLATAAALALAVLVLLTIFGIARFVIRRRRGNHGAPPTGPGPPLAVSGPLVQPLYGVYRVPRDDDGTKPHPANAPPTLPRPRKAETPPRGETPEKKPAPVEAEEKPPPAETEELSAETPTPAQAADKVRPPAE